ncbi:hypothetical protein BH20ACT24_BH20ACT24_07740 [soil metagenome]
MLWAPAEALSLSGQQMAELRRLVRAPKMPQKVALRAKVALAAAQGRSNNAIASELGVSRPTVFLWRDRMATPGVEGIIHDATRPGRRRAIPPEVVDRVVDATLNTRPEGATHWCVQICGPGQGQADDCAGPRE